MKILEKLALQKTLGGLVLFREGIFLRAYNESVYILTEILKQDLKVQFKPLKKSTKRWAFICGFPASKLNERLTNAKLTDFGAQLMGAFSMDGYPKWFDAHYRYANEVSEVIVARSGVTGVTAKRATKNGQKESDKSKHPLLLNQKQLHYLQNWQKGHYPIEIDLRFIESLKGNLREY